MEALSPSLGSYSYDATQHSQTYDGSVISSAPPHLPAPIPPLVSQTKGQKRPQVTIHAAMNRLMCGCELGGGMEIIVAGGLHCTFVSRLWCDKNSVRLSMNESRVIRAANCFILSPVRGLIMARCGSV